MFFAIYVLSAGIVACLLTSRLGAFRRKVGQRLSLSAGTTEALTTATWVALMAFAFLPLVNTVVAASWLHSKLKR